MNFKYYKPKSPITFIPILTILITALYSLCEKWINSVELIKNLSNFISVLSILGFVTLILSWIDKRLWKLKITNPIIDIPNLNGRYEGELISSYKDNNGNDTKLKCVMEITQTASYVHVCTYVGSLNNVESSKSTTICEELRKQDNDIFRLFYNYENQSHSHDGTTHKGTAYLEYFPDIKALRGKYFNDKKNTGAFNVTFVTEELIGRFNV